VSTWLLLRGWARESRHWDAFPAHLGSALGARVIVADLPGAGALCAQRSPLTIPRIAEAVRGAQRVPDKLYLLGISLGAMVALEWALRYPIEIAGCVLVNSSLRPFSAFYQRLQPRHYATLMRLALFERDAQVREATILRLTSSAAPSAALVSKWARYATEQPMTRANVLRQLLAATCYRAPKSRPAVPLLLLASRHDALVDARCSIALAESWRVPIAIHDSAGHDLALDDGPWVVSQVRDWLTRT
jgi:pimeloyl-ACP methyl ester carboxylesterase